MIDVKESVRTALDYLSNLYDTSGFKDILLEEVELSEDEKRWNVTIGFTRPVYSDNPIRAALEKATMDKSGIQYKREYKVFEISADDGKVRAMKIREV